MKQLKTMTKQVHHSYLLTYHMYRIMQRSLADLFTKLSWEPTAPLYCHVTGEQMTQFDLTSEVISVSCFSSKLHLYIVQIYGRLSCFLFVCLFVVGTAHSCACT